HRFVVCAVRGGHAARADPSAHRRHRGGHWPARELGHADRTGARQLHRRPQRLACLAHRQLRRRDRLGRVPVGAADSRLRAVALARPLFVDTPCICVVTRRGGRYDRRPTNSTSNSMTLGQRMTHSAVKHGTLAALLTLVLTPWAAQARGPSPYLPLNLSP